MGCSPTGSIQTSCRARKGEPGCTGPSRTRLYHYSIIIIINNNSTATLLTTFTPLLYDTYYHSNDDDSNSITRSKPISGIHCCSLAHD